MQVEEPLYREARDSSTPAPPAPPLGLDRPAPQGARGERLGLGEPVRAQSGSLHFANRTATIVALDPFSNRMDPVSGAGLASGPVESLPPQAAAPSAKAATASSFSRLRIIGVLLSREGKGHHIGGVHSLLCKRVDDPDIAM
ncbi:MAG TPA: hypothetical protein VFZ21_05970 [Gemmatimonadaceae bacterium]|nr:hypothetical protein [Gemmatimonadaceae bacterium]